MPHMFDIYCHEVSVNCPKRVGVDKNRVNAALDLERLRTPYTVESVKFRGLL
jgi:hypothetical protein